MAALIIIVMTAFNHIFKLNLASVAKKPKTTTTLIPVEPMTQRKRITIMYNN